jgi:phosphoribosylanthranilate isomerase
MTKIKICGIKTVSDALAAMDAGADLIGFNFYPKSPRFVEVGLCRGIMSTMRNFGGHVQYVGVFVNASVAEIHATMETCGLNLAQLHGDESPDMLQELGERGFKAFRGLPENIDGFARQNAPAFLLDASVKGVYGGSGVTPRSFRNGSIGWLKRKTRSPLSASSITSAIRSAPASMAARASVTVLIPQILILVIIIINPEGVV